MMAICEKCGARIECGHRIEGWRGILVTAFWDVVFTLVFAAVLLYVYCPEPPLLPLNPKVTYG